MATADGNRASGPRKLPDVEQLRHDRHRRRPGGALRRLLPEAAGPAVRDPRRERADRRLVADANLGLAAPVHAGPLRRPAGLAASRPPAGRIPTADETADYLEAYAARFDLPVRPGTRVDRLTKAGDRYVVDVRRPSLRGGRRSWSRRGFYGKPSVPDFASELDPRIVQMHSSEYRDPSQLRPGGVLLVGAGNSGADIAMEVSHEPPRPGSRGPTRDRFRFASSIRSARLFVPVLWFVASHVLTIRTPLGRKVRPHILAEGAPRIRVKSADLARRRRRAWCRGPSGCRTACRCSRTGASSTSRTSSGARASARTSAGSTSRSSTRTSSRCTNAASPPSRVSTSSASTSSTRSPRRTSAACGGTPKRIARHIASS